MCVAKQAIEILIQLTTSLESLAIESGSSGMASATSGGGPMITEAAGAGDWACADRVQEPCH